MLFIRTNQGLQSGLEFGLFVAIFLIGHLALIPVIRLAAKELELPTVKPWGEFDEDRQAVPVGPS